MQNKLINRKTLFVAFALFAAYTAIYFVTPPLFFVEVLSALFCGSVAAGGIVYSRLIFTALTTQAPLDHVRAMTLGIMCSWLANFFVVAYVVTSRREDYLTGLIVGLALLGGVLQISAANRGDGELKVRDERILHIALGVGAAVAGLVIMLHVML